MLQILIFLIVFPLVTALLLLPFKSVFIRRMIAVPANIALIAASIYLYIIMDRPALYFHLEIPHIGLVMLAVEILMAAYIVFLAYRSRKYFIIILAISQIMLMVVFEAVSGKDITTEYNLYLDNFSIIMALIVGIIGSLIVNYAIGYLTEYHEHYPEVKNRRKMFFLLMYLFLSAMYGIVFSNNILWLSFFWEITTFCSFLLIGYRDDEVSRNNSFLALGMNLAGGIFLASGAVIFYYDTGFMELDRMISAGSGVALLPAVLLCLAGLIKSAQIPFSSWLTGAMVAPTPVSALLHSSTMVKAGVFLILKVSPVLKDTPAGLMLSLIGGVTFLFASFIAVSQSNAKKLLAYSTISNLGLIVMCAGIDTPEAILSAMLLIVFHAVAKSLLFLSVGVVEYKLHSRDIEDMDYLLNSMPRVAVMMNIGIGGMFLAPFGMLISKWVTLKAFVDFNPVLGIILAFGSGATLLFYTQWMGKVIMIQGGVPNREDRISAWEWITMIALSVMTVGVCLMFPMLSESLIEPYVRWVYGVSLTIDEFNINVIILIMVSLLVIFPIGLFYDKYLIKNYKKVGTYLGGANIDEVTYLGAKDRNLHGDIRNYYYDTFFNEKRLITLGNIAALVLVLIMIGVAVI